MKASSYFLVFFATLSLFSCGRRTSPGTEVQSAPPTRNLTLVLFGAPSCENCHVAYEKLNPLIRDYVTKYHALKVKVFVTAGASSLTSPPTPNDIEIYKTIVGKDYDYALDMPPKYSNYRNYISKNAVGSIPAAALLDEGGTIIVKFPPGSEFTGVNVAAGVKYHLYH